MRYVVQVLTIGKAAQAGVKTVFEKQLIDAPDQTASFIQGTVDDDRLRRLLELGLRVSVIAERPTAGQERAFRSGVVAERGVMKSFGGAVRGAIPTYYQLELAGVLTPAVRRRLTLIGLRFLERVSGRLWTVRLDGSPNAVRNDPAVTQLRPAGSPPAPSPNTRTFRSFGVALGDATLAPVFPYEAIAQPDVEGDLLSEALRSRGAEILTVSGRTVRFLADQRVAQAVAALETVASINAVGVPRPLHNLVRPLVGVVGPVDGRPIGLDGDGEIIGIADTGIDADHPDFAGRLLKIICRGRLGDGSDPDGHGTHVAGSAAGDGNASEGLLAGIAPKAEIVFQSLMDAGGGLGGLPNDVGELFAEAYAEGVRVHNNSWGIFLNARYPGVSLQVDKFVDEHPDFLPVIAAGNDGSCLPGRNAGAPGLIDLPSMAAPGTSKNGLVVGASRSTRTDLGYAHLTYGETWPDSFNSPPISDQKVSGDPTGLAAFSARGPTDDMRVKPDVVAPGTDIVSTRSSSAPLSRFWGSYPNNDKYAVMGGTSMACPIVSGLAVLVRQYFQRDRGHLPSAALLRATIVNGAEPLTGADAVAHPQGTPNFHQGFGRVDLLRTVPTPETDFNLEFIDTFSQPDLELADSGDYVAFKFEVTQPCDIRICLAWTDTAGRSLQNALFITVEAPNGSMQHSNDKVATLFNFPTPFPPGLPGGTIERDPNNNLHIMRFVDATPGEYEVTVASWDLMRRQGFALVITGAVTSLTQVHDV